MLTPDGHRNEHPLASTSKLKRKSPIKKTTSSTESHSSLSKFLMAFTKTHQGKSLEVDCEQETMRLLGPNGQELAHIETHHLVNHLMSLSNSDQSKEWEGTSRHQKTESKIKVLFRIPDGDWEKGKCRGMDSKGFFLEAERIFPVGTPIEIELFLEKDMEASLTCRGGVIWACPHSDQFSNSSGMGIHFTKN